MLLTYSATWLGGKLLPTDEKKSRLLFPALAWDFSLVESYPRLTRTGCFCVSLFFVHVMSCVVFGGGPCTLLTIGPGVGGGAPALSEFIHVFHKIPLLLTLG